MKDFKCNLTEIKPISQWVKDGEGCPPCLIAPLASHYLGVLENSGMFAEATKLKNVYEGGQLLTICEELDRIKDFEKECVHMFKRDDKVFKQCKKCKFFKKHIDKIPHRMYKCEHENHKGEYQWTRSREDCKDFIKLKTTTGGSTLR